MNQTTASFNTMNINNNNNSNSNTGYPQTQPMVPNYQPQTQQPYNPQQPQQNTYSTPQQPQTQPMMPNYQQPQQPQPQQPQYGQPTQPMMPNYQQQQPQQQQQQYNQQYGMSHNNNNQQQQQIHPEPTEENMCPKSFLRLSMNAIPNSSSSLSKTHIPLGCTIKPLAEDPLNPVPVVSSTIVRCKRCRSYINPFVVWMNGGGRWKCNICDNVNDTANDYFSPIDFSTGKRVDINQRPELSRGCVEFVATKEYTIRAPQPPTYFFVIDVCYESLISGMLPCAINAIRESLDSLQQESRTKFGIMTFDESLHLYNLKNTPSGKPQMFVVTEMDNVYVPPFSDFLVNLKESRQVIENTLDIILSLAKQTNIQKVESCLGSALKAAYQITERIGGKIVVLQSYLPRGPIGLLPIRDLDRSVLGTKKETALLQPSTEGEFYKEFALGCISNQLCIDLFLFSNRYTDTASLGSLCQITGGQMFYYPSFTAAKDGQVFAANLIRSLTRNTAWEAVMRVRTSRGLNITSYHGNYFLKQSDLLGLPTIDSDKTITLQISITDNINSKFSSLQSALLYSHSCGERRVRVFTVCLPVINNYADLFKYADIAVVTNLISKMAIDKALSSSLSDAREALANKCVEILTAYKGTLANNRQNANPITLSTQAPNLILPESLKYLPLYVVAMVKNVVFSSHPTNPDLRSFHMQRLKSLDLDSCLNFFYPYFYSLLIPFNPQTQSPQPQQLDSTLPASHKLSSDALSRAGLFVVVNGYSLYVFVGEELHPKLCMDIFGCDQNMIDIKLQDLPVLDNEHSRYARKIIELARAKYSEYMKFTLVRANDKIRRPDFQSLLIEDKTPEGCSYFDFIMQLQQRIQKS